MTGPNPYTPAPDDNTGAIQRYTVLAIILLCTFVCLLLGSSLISAYRIELGEPVSRGWGWLLGGPVQTFGTSTTALLLGVALLGIALGGVWFLLATLYRWLRRLF